jgi:WD40 repeat protein
MDRDEKRALRRGEVSLIAFSPDGRQLAAGLDHEVAVLDLADGETTARILTDDYVASLAFSPNGGLVAIGEGGGGLLMWNPANGDSNRITPPGRERYSWPLPTAALVLWIFIARYLWVRRK